MGTRAGPFAGVAPRPGRLTIVLLDVPGRAIPLRLTARLTPPVRGPDPAGVGRVARFHAADRAVERAVRRMMTEAGAAAPGCTAFLGYIAHPRQPEAHHINEMGVLARRAWAAAGWAWLEVSPLWLARFVSDEDEGSAAAVWRRLDAGLGVEAGADGYGWAAALAHVARCAAMPEAYAPWRAALARELARW